MIQVSMHVMVVRIILIAIAMGLWYATQALIGKRTTGVMINSGGIWDGIHQLTAKYHRRLLDHPAKANALLISSSLVIDLLGFYLLGTSIFGPTIQPFVGLFILFALRQICQAFCPLPPPDGMIWRNPGFPAVLVTYGTSNDLFFSGHTAIAIFGAMTLATTFGPIGIALGIMIAVFEISTVLILRAHYTMDVFAGAITALYVHHIAWQFAPYVDRFIKQLS